MDMDCKLLREAVSGPKEELTGGDRVNGAGIALQIERIDIHLYKDIILVVIVGQSVQGSMTCKLYSI